MIRFGPHGTGRLQWGWCWCRARSADLRLAAAADQSSATGGVVTCSGGDRLAAAADQSSATGGVVTCSGGDRLAAAADQSSATGGVVTCSDGDRLAAAADQSSATGGVVTCSDGDRLAAAADQSSATGGVVTCSDGDRLAAAADQSSATGGVVTCSDGDRLAAAADQSSATGGVVTCSGGDRLVATSDQSCSSDQASARGHVRVAICQINPTVGDFGGNLARARGALTQAEAAGADLAVMPELSLVGYPPEDLVLRSDFVADSRAALREFAMSTGRCVAVVGFVDGEGESSRAVEDVAGVGSFSHAYNAVAVCAQGRVQGVYHKRYLPNYDVFDELRHFCPGDGEPPLFEAAGVAFGVTICEDAWVPHGPVSDLARAGARLVLNVNGSPFREGKQMTREEVVAERVAESGVPIVYVNLVGGQDELVFDGGSFVIAADGSVAARCVSFAESVDVVDIKIKDIEVEPGEVEPGEVDIGEVEIGEVEPGGVGIDADSDLKAEDPHSSGVTVTQPMDIGAQRWEALVLATRDYVHKSGFSEACIGLSGGIDSSLTAAVAAGALGAEHVHGVLMPSRHSSGHSVADAEKLAANLGIDALTVVVEPAHAALVGMLQPSLRGGRLVSGSLTDQNLQARIRGTTLMALANDHGWLVLTTGNKSELAVGYSTLYGDTAGAYAVISDLWKLDVYELCRWLNNRADYELIPGSILTKAPSAELAPGQRDDQSLPPYEVLDPILRLYVEDSMSIAEIAQRGLAAPDVVQQVCQMVDAAEYKRRQSPLGPRLSRRAFGRDRRMPVVNRHNFTSRHSTWAAQSERDQ